MHWAERKKIKDNFAKTVYALLCVQTDRRKFERPCEVEYIFEFKSRPLDCSNAIGMVKMLEDVLFPDDGYKIVKKISVTSLLSVEDKVTVIIKEIE